MSDLRRAVDLIDLASGRLNRARELLRALHESDERLDGILDPDAVAKVEKRVQALVTGVGSSLSAWDYRDICKQEQADLDAAEAARTRAAALSVGG